MLPHHYKCTYFQCLIAAPSHQFWVMPVCILASSVLPTNYQVPPLTKKQQTQQQNKPFRLSLWNTSQPSNLLWLNVNLLPFSVGCSWPQNCTQVTFLHPLPPYTQLYPFAALQDRKFSCWLTTPPSSLLPKLLFCHWATTPAGPMILQIILNYTSDWYSSPGCANSIVQAASSLFPTLPSVIWPASSLSTDPVLVSSY